MKIRASIALMVLLVGARADAQEAIVEGIGVELGEGTVLHPSAGVETGFISNLFYEDANTTTVPVLRVSGSFAIAAQQNKPEDLAKPPTETSAEALDPEAVPEDEEAEKPTFDFRIAGRLAYDQLIHTDLEVTEQSNLSGGLDATVSLMPHGTFSVYADNSLDRDTRPRNFESIGNLNRWVNHFQGGVRWMPGAGALAFALRYENFVDYFESSQSAFANRMNQLLLGRAEWQFLPITRFFFEGSYGFYGPMSDGSQKASSTPLRLQLGIASLITENTSIRSHVGFGKGFYAAGPDFTNVLFGAEFGLRYSPMGRFTVAYEYGFEDSINANFYRDHAIVGKVDQQISLFLLTAGAQVRMRGYRGVFAALGPPTRDDLILRLHAKAHYLYRDWLAFTGELEAVSDSTQYMDALGDDPSFNRVDFLVGGVAAF